MIWIIITYLSGVIARVKRKLGWGRNVVHITTPDMGIWLKATYKLFEDSWVYKWVYQDAPMTSLPVLLIKKMSGKYMWYITKL